MATLFVQRAPRAFALGLGLSAAAFTTHTALRAHNRPLLCEGLGAQQGQNSAWRTYQQNAKVPLMTQDGKVNKKIFRQISSGSILGLLGGVAVSTFSKTLTVLIGTFIAGAQYLESKGLHIIPTDRIQRFFKNIDVKSAVEDNVAFKIAFGTTFALAAFAEF